MNKHLMRAATASCALAMIGVYPRTAAADTTLALFEHDSFQHQSGDQFLFAGDVFDRPGGMFLGTTSGVCTTLSSSQGAQPDVCNATLNLAGGQLVVQGTGDLQSNDVHPLTVLGGNGIYTDAACTGTVQIPQDVPNQTDANFVLNLTSR